MSVAQRIVKKINNLAIRKTQMATIHAIDGNCVDIIIGKTSVAVRGVEVIGGTDTLKIGEELPVSWVDGRPVIFSGTNEQVTEIDVDGIVESVLSQVSYELNSNGVSLDIFNSHRGNPSAHHSPVTVSDSPSIMFTLAGQNITANVDEAALDFVRPSRRVDGGIGMLGGGTLENDIVLDVNEHYPFNWTGNQTFTNMKTVFLGNVGINVSDPLEKLEVDGNIVSRSNIVVHGNLLPFENGVSDIGSVDKEFRKLYLSGELTALDEYQMKRVYLRDDIGDLLYARYSNYGVEEGYLRSIILGHNSASMTGSSHGMGSIIIGDAIADASYIEATVAIGHNALRNANLAETSVVIGCEAAETITNAGDMVVIGHKAMRHSTGGSGAIAIGSFASGYSIGNHNIMIGIWAGAYQVGGHGIGIGMSALEKNMVDYAISIGDYSGHDNTGEKITSVGHYSAEQNNGDFLTAFGFESAKFNTLHMNSFFGAYSGLLNSGSESLGLGFEANINNEGAFNIAIGCYANNGFLENPMKSKSWGKENVYANDFTITAHGFGVPGSHVNLKFIQGSHSVRGMVDGQVYKFYIVDENTIKLLVSATNYVEVPAGSSGNSFLPQFVYENSIAIGSGVQITKSNQIKLGSQAYTSTIFYPNVGIGVEFPSDTLDVNGNIVARGHLMPYITDTSDIGSQNKMWRKGWISELESIVFAENTAFAIGGWVMVAKAQGSLVYDYNSTSQQINFGQTMAPGDFVVIRSSVIELFEPKTEYLQVGTLVSGTTYNVTRGVGGISAKDWVAGTVYVVLGNVGDGRIEIQGGSSPRLSMILQGATYNAQTEQIRIGDLNGMPGISTETYGIFIGDAANHLKYADGVMTITGIDGSSITNIDGGNITTGFLSADRIQAGTISAGLLSATAIDGKTITGSIIRTAASGARTEMNASNLFNLGFGGIGGYDGTLPQWYARSDTGKLYAGAGMLSMDQNGLWVKNGADEIFGVSAVNGISWSSFTADKGDIILGDNTAGKSALRWDASSGKFEFWGNASGSANLVISTTGALALGAVTSASAGTGIWVDKTGLYSVKSNVYQVKIDAANGKLYAGSGSVVLDNNGVTLMIEKNPNGFNEGKALKWNSTFSSAFSSYIYAYQASGDKNVSYMSINAGLDSDSMGFINLTANANGAHANDFVGLHISGQDGIMVRAGNTLAKTTFQVEGSIIVVDKFGYGLSKLIIPMGTAALPTMTFDADENTGIYSPWADQLSIATGGGERARFTANGQEIVNGDLKGNYSAVSITIGDGVNVIADGASIRVPVPYNMTLVQWFFNAPATVSGHSANISYYNGSSWGAIITMSNYTGTNTGGALSTALTKHTVASQKLLQYGVVTSGGAKEITMTLIYKKTGWY